MINENENLIAAAYHGDLLAMRISIERGANVNYKDQSGYTPLHWVSFLGLVGTNRVELARYLIEMGANVNSFLSEDGPSILSTACESGNLEIIKLLVENGADINDDRDGDTPLIHSIYLGDINIVEYLLLNGSDPKKRALSGLRPIDIAIQAERSEIAELIHKHLSTS